MNFGITPARITAIAAVWSREATTVSDLSLPDELAAADCASLAVLSCCARNSRKSSRALGDELNGLSHTLRLFNARTVESDGASAAQMASGDAP